MLSPGCMASSPNTDFTSSPFLSEYEDPSYFHMQFQQQLQQLQQQQLQIQQLQQSRRQQQQQQDSLMQLTNNHALPLHFPAPPQKMRKVHLEGEESEGSTEFIQSYQQYHERRLMGTQYQQQQQQPKQEQVIVPKRSYSIGNAFPYGSPVTSSSYQVFPEQEPRRYSLPANPSASSWSPLNSSWSSFPAHSPSPSPTPSMSACSSVSFGSQPDLTASTQYLPGSQVSEHTRKRSFDELGGGRSSPSASASPSPNTGPHGSSAAMSPPPQPLASSQEPHFLATLLQRQTQLRIESETAEEPFDSEKILRQSKQMRNKLRSILGKLKKTC